jgi:hypothetical protein
MWVSPNTENTFNRPCSQRVKDTWKRMQGEIQKKRQFLTGDSEYLRKKKIFQRQLSKEFLNVDLKSGSAEELQTVMASVSAALTDHNRKVRVIRLGIKGQRRLVLTTRDWSILSFSLLFKFLILLTLPFSSPSFISPFTTLR